MAKINHPTTPSGSDSTPQKPPLQSPQPLVGKPWERTPPTPTVDDFIISVRKDTRAAGFKMPEKGDAYTGVDEANAVNGPYMFAKAVTVEQMPGFVDLYYLRPFKQQEAYNWTVEYPYVDKSYPRLTRTYWCLRSDYAVIKEPTSDTVDSTSPDLYLVDHKLERITDEPVLDALFIKVIRIFERLPSPIITTYKENQYQQVQTITTQEVVSSPPPPLSAVVEEGDQERTGTAKAKNITATVPRVFPAISYQMEIPSLVREEFLGGFSERVTHQRLAGQATVPNIGVGEFDKVNIQTTEFIYETTTKMQDMPQTRVHKEVTEEYGGGVLTETLQLDTPSSALDVTDGGFLITEAKLRDITNFGKIKTTKQLTSIERSSIDVLNPGYGYTSAPSISVLPAAGAVAAAQMGQTVDHVIVTSPGGNQYDFPPAVNFNGPSVAPAQGIAFISKGVSYILMTAHGTGYRSAPAVQFSGGGGTGAAATANIGKTINRIVVTNKGYGYRHPIVAITGGGGARGTAIVKAKNLTRSGQILRITLVNEGRHYDSAPTVTIFDKANNGTGATAVAIMESEGYVKSIILTNSGIDYTTTPTVNLVGGGGTGAAAQAFLSNKGRLSRIILTYGGLGYSHAPIISLVGGSFDGNIVQGAATAVLSSTFHVAKIVLQTPGAYAPGSPEPRVIFTGGGGQGAQAQYIIGGWPVLYGSTVNTKYGLITQITKRIVPAGTQWRPGLGFTEVHPHDKWRSIMITSRVDPQSLPPPVIYPTVRELHLPSTLLAVVPNITSTNEDSVTGTKSMVDSGGTPPPGANFVVPQIVKETLVATADISGSFETTLKHGYQGPAAALVQELFFLGPPNPRVLPIPLKITPSYGTVVMKTTNHRASVTTGLLAYGHGNRTTTRIETRTIGPVLTGPFHFFVAGGSANASAVGWTPTPTPISLVGPPIPGDPNTQVFAGNLEHVNLQDKTFFIPANTIEAVASWDLSVGLPMSDPLFLNTGTVFLENMQTERLGLNVWMVRMIYILIP